MSKNTQLTYYQKNQHVILNRPKEYYKNNCDKIKKQAKDKYNLPEKRLQKIEYEKNKYYNISEEKKDKRREFGRERYCNMSEEQKNKITECATSRCYMIKPC